MGKGNGQLDAQQQALIGSLTDQGNAIYGSQAGVRSGVAGQIEQALGQGNAFNPQQSPAQNFGGFNPYAPAQQMAQQGGLTPQQPGQQERPVYRNPIQELAPTYPVQPPQQQGGVWGSLSNPGGYNPNAQDPYAGRTPVGGLPGGTGRNPIQELAPTYPVQPPQQQAMPQRTSGIQPIQELAPTYPVQPPTDYSNIIQSSRYATNLQQGGQPGGQLGASGQPAPQQQAMPQRTSGIQRTGIDEMGTPSSSNAWQYSDLAGGGNTDSQGRDWSGQGGTIPNQRNVEQGNLLGGAGNQPPQNQPPQNYQLPPWQNQQQPLPQYTPGQGPGAIPGSEALFNQLGQAGQFSTNQGFNPSASTAPGRFSGANQAGQFGGAYGLSQFNPSQQVNALGQNAVGSIMGAGNNPALDARQFNAPTGGLNQSIQQNAMQGLAGPKQDLLSNLFNQVASGVNESSAARGAFGGSANQQQIMNAFAPMALQIAQEDRARQGQQFGQGLQASDLLFGQGANTFGINQGAQNQAYQNQLQLAGAQGGLQNQLFGQGAQQFGANQGAQQQQYNQALGQFGANQGAQQQAYNQGLGQFQANLGAQGQQYGQEAGTYGLNQANQNQNFQNAMQLAGQGAGLQQQMYGQAQGQHEQGINDYLRALTAQQSVNVNNREQALAPLQMAMQFLGLGQGNTQLGQGLQGLQGLAGQRLAGQGQWMDLLGTLGGTAGRVMGGF